MIRHEQNFWQFLRQAPGIFFKRLESRFAGWPDVLYLTNNQATGWIELKVIDGWCRVSSRNKTGATNIGLRKEQVGWLGTWAAKGGNAFILVQVKRDREFVVFSGQQALALARDGATRSAAASVLPLTPGGRVGLVRFLDHAGMGKVGTVRAPGKNLHVIAGDARLIGMPAPLSLPGRMYARSPRAYGLAS